MKTVRVLPRGFPWRAWIVPVVFLVLAQLLAMATNFHSDELARPSEIFMAAGEAMSDGSLWAATGQTLWAAFSGLLIGGSLGLILGLAFGLLPIVFYLLEFSVDSIRPIPSIALLPIVMLIFGFGFRMEITLVAKASIWPVMLMTHAAIRGIDQRLIDVSRILGFSHLNRILKIILPAALPGIFVGFRLAVGIALVVAVTVEIAVNPLGLGYSMMMSQQALRPDLMYAYLLWVGIIGWAINCGTSWAQTRLINVSAGGASS